jgi:hypothetical protein
MMDKLKCMCAIGIPIIGTMSVIGYESRKINTSDTLSGSDRSLRNCISRSTLTTIIMIDNQMDVIEDSIRKKLMIMYQDPMSVINRYTVYHDDEDKKIIHGHVYDNNELIECKINMMIKRKNLTPQEEKVMLESTYISNPSNEYAKFIVLMDDMSNKMYVQTNHAYFDEWTFANVMSDLLSEPTNKYLSQIPRFKYLPFISEYKLIRTIIDKFKMTDRQLTSEPNIGTYCVNNILHFTESDPNPMSISHYTYKIMSLFFDAYPTRNHYNVMILCTMENSRKINNIAFISFTIERTHTLKDIKKKIQKRKYMVWGSYFCLNSFLSSIRSISYNLNTDVCISSSLFLKDDGMMRSMGSVMRYTYVPVHVVNCKIDKESTSSVHFGIRELDVKAFEETLDRNNIIVHEKTVFENRVSVDISESKPSR